MVASGRFINVLVLCRNQSGTFGLVAPREVGCFSEGLLREALL